MIDGNRPDDKDETKEIEQCKDHQTAIGFPVMLEERCD
jgi:hypothetical protein